MQLRDKYLFVADLDKDPSRIQAPMYSPHYPRGKETLSARNGGYGAVRPDTNSSPSHRMPFRSSNKVSSCIG
jgi:hypothetical protein